MNAQTITPKELKEMNNVADQLKVLSKTASRSALGKSAFCYYTSLDTFCKIYQTKKIWISNCSQMNDKREFFLDNELSKKKDYYHLLCLSNRDEENIPMWYIYSGAAGDGIRIRFTSSIIKDIILNGKMLTPNGEILDKDKYNIKAGWIFYRINDSFYQYKGQKYSINGDERKFWKDNMFIKSHYWDYEKEFRIVIENKDIESYPYLQLDISDYFDKITFMFGPEFEYSKIKGYPIAREVRNSSQFKFSELEISMGSNRKK